MEILLRSVQEWAQDGEFVVVEGERIFIRQVGGHGPTVVLLHGFPGSSHDWREVAAALAGQHRVVTLDLLGFGLSDKPAGARYSLYDQAELVEWILVELGIVECVLVSHDMGDTVAAELLHRHTAGQSALDIRFRGPLAASQHCGGSVTRSRCPRWWTDWFSCDPTPR